MAKLSGIVKQLKNERDRVERHLSALNAALTAFANVYGGSEKPTRKRRVSAKSRAKMAAAQRARWAKIRVRQKVVPIAPSSTPRKRTMPPSARRKIAAAQRARWAKIKKAK
jgi:hypothetical protein